MSELDLQIANRRAKRDALRDAGTVTYPHRFEFDLEASAIHERYGEHDAEQLESLAVALRTPGRITAIRRQGKVIFADLHDGRTKVQLFARMNDLDDATWALVSDLDLGDIVGVSGTLMRTRMGELSLRVATLELLSKSLRPMPEKWHGLRDAELRYRQRYVDLLVTPESRRTFEVRARLVRGIRRFLDERDFLEVETPMMQSLAGGAAARPFQTHHNALDLDLYLRVAPELYLKRLLVGGIPRVYEINRNFRNEGISTQHNPEFTMLEFYWAYVDYYALMDLTEEMVAGLADEILGASTLDWKLDWKDEKIDLTRPWRRLTMRDATAQLGGVDPTALDDVDSLRAEFDRRELERPAADDYGHLLLTLFEATAESHLIQPTFITEHPVEVSPLAKQKPEDPRFTERFELYLGGMEIANAFSELNDPDTQAERFKQQLAVREQGDDEAHRFDHDYVRALEYGMPPAGGEGVGIDRLTMLFTNNTSIRDVILFPLLRPRLAKGAEGSADDESKSATDQESGA